MEKWRSNESSIQFFTTLNLAAPVPHHMLYRRRVGRERARKSYLARPSSLFGAAPTPSSDGTRNQTGSAQFPRRPEGREGKQIGLSRPWPRLPLLFSPQQEATDAERADEVQDTRGVYSEPCNRREQHNRNRCRSAGKSRPRTTRSFGDRPPGVGNSYCDTTDRRAAGRAP